VCCTDALLWGILLTKTPMNNPLNDHLNNLPDNSLENPRSEAAKAFDESLRKLEELWKESTANHDPVDSLDEELLEEFASAAEDIERFFDGDQNLDETSAVVDASTGEIKP